jgi:hypothetical protein
MKLIWSAGRKVNFTHYTHSFEMMRKDFSYIFECFDELLNLIKDDIQKQCTNYRESIEPVERLTVTLR